MRLNRAVLVPNSSGSHVLFSLHYFCRPVSCPQKVYQSIMVDCWIEDPKQRPLFVDLVSVIETYAKNTMTGLSKAATDTAAVQCTATSSTTSPSIDNRSGYRAARVFLRVTSGVPPFAEFRCRARTLFGSILGWTSCVANTVFKN